MFYLYLNTPYAESYPCLPFLGGSLYLFPTEGACGPGWLECEQILVHMTTNMGYDFRLKGWSQAKISYFILKVSQACCVG